MSKENTPPESEEFLIISDEVRDKLCRDCQRRQSTNLELAEHEYKKTLIDLSFEKSIAV